MVLEKIINVYIYVYACMFGEKKKHFYFPKNVSLNVSYFTKYDDCSR